MPPATNDSSSLPPPRGRRPIALVLSGVAVAALLLVVAFNLDRGDATDPDPIPMTAEITDLLPPTLTAEELEQQDASAASMDEPNFDLPSGGWIQIAGDDGRLAQQYRFDRLDPDPPGQGAGWIAMTDPEFEVYFSDGRLVRLMGATALAHAPSRAVESGAITGDVIIRLYEPPPGAQRRADPARDAPSLIVRTTEAEFDNVFGEVRCPGTIELETRSSVFAGRALTMLIDDQADVVRHLQVDEVSSIRLATARPADPNAMPEPAAAASDVPAAPTPTTPPVPSNPAVADVRPAPAATPPAAAPADTTFYRLVLSDDVRIRQGDGDTARTATGDRLEIVFTAESEGFVVETAMMVPPVAPAPGPPSLAAFLAAAALARVDEDASIAPPPHPDDVYVTCRGPLTVTPIDDPAEHLASARDAVMTLAGSPVRLDDVASATAATGGRLVYDVRTDDLALEPAGAPDALVVVRSPRLDAEAERFWVRRRAGRAGFDGPGRADLYDLSETHVGPRPADVDRLDVRWADGVDIAFIETEAEGVANTPQRDLESIAFRGAVTIDGSAVRLDETTETGGLDAERLELGFSAGELTRLVARTAVAARDDTQQIWCEALDVVLRPGADDPAERVESAVAAGGVFVRRASGELVFADRLDLSGTERTADLVGENIALVDGDTMLDGAQHIIANDADERYEVIGPGRLRRLDAAPVLPATDRLVRADVSGRWDAADELVVTWTRGVEVYRVRPADGGASIPDDTPRLARCRGAVTARTPDLSLEHADELTVRFRNGTDDDSAELEELSALGAVRARSLGDPGELRCERLVVRMVPGPDGARPERAEATGGIILTDGLRHVWASRLDVTFGPETEADSSGFDVAIASGPVQVRLEDGQRVFADRLTVREDGAIAELDGAPLFIVGETFALERGTRLVLNRRDGAYRLPGAGTFSTFREPLGLAADARPIEPPPLPATRDLVASWREHAEYRESEAGLGQLELVGAVDAVSRPTPRETTTVTCGRLDVDLAPDPDAPEDRDARRVAAIRARQSAVLESRTWSTDERRDLPRVFFLRGDDIEFDQMQFNGRVYGPGELLIREPVGTDGTSQTGFARGGTTLLRWQTQLGLRSAGTHDLILDLDGEVACIHEDPSGASSTLTGQRLSAQVRRDRAWRDESRAGLALGGRIELRRLDGHGGVMVRTPRRDVACDHFLYDVIAGRAELSADPGRMVSVFDQDAAEPVRHGRLVWDMITDTITVERGAGSGVP